MSEHSDAVTEVIEVLVEEPSMERTLRSLLGRLLPGVRIEVRVFNGKPDLLRKLPSRLQGYAYWPAQTKIVVVVDRDDDDCHQLKDRIASAATAAGLTVASVGGRRSGQVLIRLAVEELEAWFIGDVNALRQAYPRMPASLGAKARFRRPDDIAGAAEALATVLHQHNYQRGGLRKIALAEDVAPHLDLERNRSKSFNVFVEGVGFLVKGAA